MDKNAIKKYAVWARRELISRVSQKAAFYGITDTDHGTVGVESVDERVLTAAEKKQRDALIHQIQKDGYEQTIEEVAYTWFNRFSALRYMEVNGYLPTHVRVFTDDTGALKPQILTEAINLELDGLDMQKVYDLKNSNQDEALYRYLLITQCNALNAILPGMFQKIEDYTELLLPDNLLREGSVIEQMVTTIPEEDWTDQVQIIGWMYQYYNAEKKDDIFAALKKNVKITKENIPAATQLFTPDWIVRYMVENSLGRLWVEGHPNEDLKTNWKYYLEEAEQEPDVQVQLAEIRKKYAAIRPEDIKAIDPCMGSGHILVYLFEVLIQIYESYGYNTRDAAGLILKNNLYGLDIDDRAAQLAYFAVMMKARQYDRHIFSRGIQPHVHAIMESNGISRDVLDYFENGDPGLKKAMETIAQELRDAKEYGSILNVSQVDFAALYTRLDEIRNDINIFALPALNELRPLIEVAEALAQKYDVVVTNPPYMAISSLSPKLNTYINEHYTGGKTDLFSAFIERCIDFTLVNKFTAMITMQSWMFLTSFEPIRKKMLGYEISSMAHLGARGFDEISGEVVQTVAFSLRKSSLGGNYIGQYSRLIKGECEYEKEQDYYSKRNLFYNKSNNFKKIPQLLIAYWVSERTINCFGGETLASVFTTREGMATADNDRFLRLWHEVSICRITIGCLSSADGLSKKIKWVPYNKGGTARDWYGNNDYVVDWFDDGAQIRRNADPKTGRIRSHNYNGEYGFKAGLTWSAISSGDLSVRYCNAGFLFDSKGAKGFADKGCNIYWILAFLNSKVSMQFLQFISPTLDFKVGDIISLPYLDSKEFECSVIDLSKKSVAISKDDWDSYETSWDFKRNPLAVSSIPAVFGAEYCGKYVTRLEDHYYAWKNECKERFENLQINEEELNRIFIDIYGLQDELTPDVADKDVTVHRVFDSKDDVPESMKGSGYVRTMRDEIVSLISYAVGCMFGRYSLDVEGLAYAGGEWDASKYKTIIPGSDNIIPICDDEYFEDDIVGRFVEFVKTVYGEDTLDENLKFIADALGGKGAPKEVIRNYFLNDFYADHCKIYQKRPIYWLFDSGKKNGFKALIYMHRYREDTIARIRTDYVHEQQGRYRTAIADLESRIANADTGSRVKLTKQLTKLQNQAEELRVYEEKIHHLADQMIRIDLDDGVKHNYELFKDVLAKIK